MVSQFWADGPNSETPPGHWYVLLNQVSDNPLFQKRYEGAGPVLNNLEWDVKAYFTLGGAVHDAAIAAWGIKGWYDSPRPISMIRKMALYGQSSNSALPSYHPGGIPLVPGYIEIVYAGDPLAGENNINIDKIKIKAWQGFSHIPISGASYAGVGWILAESWMPYQRKTFVTPPFAGYISGHSTYSRAAAEVLTSITGSAYFPGGMGEYLIPANSNFLGFESGPSEDIRLQWATYRDASNQSSLSRIWGGIHPPFDDIPGRLIGQQIGIAAYQKAKTYFLYTVLPVTLTNFTANEKDCNVNIQWETANEFNSSTYTVVKSEDGIHFNTIVATIPAAGNSNTAKNYSVTDANPSLNNFYKLIQIDIDGKRKEYNTVHVPIKNCNTLFNSFVVHIQPNPVQYQTSITFLNTGNQKQIDIAVFDIIGKVQFVQSDKLQTGNNRIILRTENLKTGTYLVKLMIDGVWRSTQKIEKIN